jgi:large subunit ribosomal protein L32
MAVPKHRRTPRMRGNRRAHDKLKMVALSTDSETGEIHLRHHATPEGWYRGRQVIIPPAAAEAAADDE